MREGKSTIKAQKLIRVLLKYDDENKIQDIKITGDFFIHPEESLEKLESELIGVKIDNESLVDAIEKGLKDSECFGFSSDDMVKAILDCVKR